LYYSPKMAWNLAATCSLPVQNLVMRVVKFLEAPEITS